MIIFGYLREILVRGNFILFSATYGFVSIFIYREEFLVLFAKPFWSFVGEGRFIFTGMGEVFQTYFSLALMGSLLSVILGIIVNMYLFVIPGLYEYERKTLTKWLKRGFVGVLGGFFVIHKLLVGFVCSYLVSYSQVKGISGIQLDFEPRLYEFVRLVVKLDIIFSLIVLMISLCFIVLSFQKDVETKIRVYRLWVYLIFILIIIIFLPADILLHLVVFVGLISCFEGLVFILLLCKMYEFAWWNW